jgi:uncharacterized protein YbjQ (UPF0145 family)
MAGQCCACGKYVDYPEITHIICDKEPSYILCEECNAYLDWLRNSTRESDLDAALSFFQPVFDNKQIPPAVKNELINIRFSREIAKEKDQQMQAYKENLSAMILTTGSLFDGYHVEKYIDVICEEVVFKNSFKNRISAGLDDIGNMFTFQETEMSGSGALIARAREYVKEKFRHKAAMMGANGVLGIEFESSIGADIVRVAVFGTAVVIKKNS